MGTKGTPQETNVGADRPSPSKFLPSYISSRSFSRALIDNLLPPENEEGDEINALRNSVLQLENESLRKALLSLVGPSVKDMNQARQNIEDWFDDAMDRVTGWYKRRLQYISLAVALVITVVFNADTIHMGKQFWDDQRLRTAVAEQAHIALSKCVQASPVTECEQWQQYANVAEELHALPLGWNKDYSQTVSTFLFSVFGWMVTALAVSLGAPFWFGLLNKLDAIRTSGTKPETHPTARA